jgi:adenine-specific DNA-methyltransferase
MKVVAYTPKQALNKAFLKQRPLRSQVDTFKINLRSLLDKINIIDQRPKDESEEHLKNDIRDFLRDTYYKDTNAINTKDKKDLVIHLDKSTDTKVGVIIEAKRPSNVAEMFSLDKPNTKALQELVLYYLRERSAGNIDIKYLIVTNIHEWFIIEASYFEKCFYRNKAFIKQFEEWRDGKKVTKDTELFYKDIARPFIDSIEEEMPCTYFNIRKYEQYLTNSNGDGDRKLIALYKILSPLHLLKAQLPNDSNELDQNFYKELLHLIGLEEAKEGSKCLIRRKTANRDSASFLEKTIDELKTEGLHKVPDISSYGSSKDEQHFNLALELCITWINRILFLKLLEGQLIKYHRGDKQYKFVNSETIPTFDELFKLFHKVLAVSVEERSPLALQQKYSRVPYLNSSLFEITELEDLTIKINALDNSDNLEFISSTILKNQRKNKEQLNTLDYLFKFLDAYDFASDGAEDIQEDNKTLINASVLGKVFEKINGYKDGSIFTPGFITMYMCRQAIRSVVVRKFNEVKGWNLGSFEALYNKIDSIDEANNIINDIKLCDPAVGSGHFLVSALNEIIAIKSELKILKDFTGKRLKEYKVEVVNDELIISDEDGEIFEYNPQNSESQRVQETLFNEKKIIIEGSLFGVDINSNSAKICRLRLWIELLKNAYYKQGKGKSELETLPNIDINIKCGNSLLSRYALDSDLKPALTKSKRSITQYREAVYSYKNSTSKEDKRELLKLISEFKNDFVIGISSQDKKVRDLNKKKSELFLLTTEDKLVEVEMVKGGKKKEREKIAELNAEIIILEKQIEDQKNNIIYKNAFEWRFEFPEVLSNKGEFEGFDLIIANPPYIRQEELGGIKNYLKDHFKVFASGGDIFSYFYELSHNLLKTKGTIAFINNTFDKTTAGRALREFVSTNFNFKKYIDFTGVVVFEEATTYPIILLAEKEKQQSVFKYFKFTKESFKSKHLIDREENYSTVSQALLNNGAWNFLSEANATLLNLISNHKTLLESYGKCYYGVKTALNDAFITEEELGASNSLKPVYEGKDLQKWIAPAPTKKMIVFPSKFTKTKYGNLNEEEALKKIQTDYSEIIVHLLPHKTEAQKRSDKGEFWWELRNCAYYDLFSKPKIIFPNLQNTNKFAFDKTGTFLNAPAVFLPTSDKHLLAILNSRIVWHFLKSICVVRSGGYIEVKPQYFEQIPIPNTGDNLRELLTNLVDYMICLNSTQTKPISEDTSNEHISKFFEDLINGCIYELYFPLHMKEREIDIISLLAREVASLYEVDSEKEKQRIILNVYKQLRSPENEIRNRLLLFATRSPEIILPIMKGF